MKSTTLTRSYYPALDGLRGFAIAAVLFHHNLGFLPFPKFGWTGVDLFFVLSGFLITDILLKTKEEKNFLQNFFIRRILRIFPLYYGITILYFILAPSLSQFKDQYSYYYTNQCMLWLHLQNWLYITNPEPNQYTVFSHFWSLSVEEQFYLVWPLIIFASKKLRTLVTILCIILFGCILFRFLSWLYFGNGNTTFHLQYMTRADGLCIGSLIAIWRNTCVQTARKKLFQLCAVLLSLHAITFVLVKTIFTNASHFSIFGFSTVSVILGTLLIFVIEKGNALTKILFENRPIKGLGKISYGLYVFHWPILVLFKIYFVKYTMNLGISNHQSYVVASMAATITAILLSILSYNLFEKKILAFRNVITTDGFIRSLKQKILPQYKSFPAE